MRPLPHNASARRWLTTTVLLAGVLTLATACDSGATESADDIPDEPVRTGGKADNFTAAGEEYGYWDVNADVPMDDVSSGLILDAMLEIDEVASDDSAPLRAALARETFNRIDQGDVLLGSVAGARGVDLWHMCKDLKHSACPGDELPSDDWEGTQDLLDAVAFDLAGYQWGNRLYFTLSDVTLDDVVATLVHEVNHVLNVSHCSYYTDLSEHTLDNDLAFMEEWRAFFVECVWLQGNEASADGCDEWARVALVDRDYGLNVPDELDTLTLAMELLSGDTGLLVPSPDVWPGDFSPCE